MNNTAAIRTDGGSEVNVFQHTGASRVEELEWVENQQTGMLYAIELPEGEDTDTDSMFGGLENMFSNGLPFDMEDIETAVKVDIIAEEVEPVSVSELDESNLVVVSDAAANSSID